MAGTFATLVLLAVGGPYALPLGFVVGILDLIPLVGATLATVIVGAVALTKGVTPLVIVVAALVVYQQFENQVLQQLVYNAPSSCRRLRSPSASPRVRRSAAWSARCSASRSPAR